MFNVDAVIANRPVPALVHESIALGDAQRGVDEIERLMQSGAFGVPATDADFPVTHRFVPGLYAREFFVPKDSVVTSKIHKTEHLFTVSKGSMSVYTEEGGVVRITAPFTGVTKPGTRRIGYTHEDTVWTTYHPTAETDLAKLEAEIIYTREEFEKIREAKHGLV